MRLEIQSFAPYDRSVRWQIHDAYFASRGLAAWKSGEIPHYSTNNYVIACQHARLILQHVRDLEASGRLGRSEPIDLLEIGAGSGRFAARLLRALGAECGGAGEGVLGRLRYILSDYSEKSVREALASPALEAAGRAGKVVPALFDVRAPGSLRGLDERPIAARPALIVANYLVCVAPLKIICKKGERFSEQYARVLADVPDGDGRDPRAILDEMLADPTRPEIMKRLEVEFEPRPIDLDALFAQGTPHARVIRDALEGLDEATVWYPYVWFDGLRALERTARPGALVLVNDYGSCSREALANDDDVTPSHFGNTLNHGVNFSLFDAYARAAGHGLLRTDDPFHSLHTAAIIFGGEPTSGLRAAFDESYVLHSDSEDVLDMSQCAIAFLRAGEPKRSARLFERCLRYDRDDPLLLNRAGEACLAAGQVARAIAHLEKGRALDAEGAYDFDRSLGRALALGGRFGDAIGLLRRGLERGPSADIWIELGLAYAGAGDIPAAWRSYRAALELEPENERATGLKRTVEEVWIAATLAREGPPPS